MRDRVQRGSRRVCGRALCIPGLALALVFIPAFAGPAAAPVIPARAGIRRGRRLSIPAYAEMTTGRIIIAHGIDHGAGLLLPAIP